MSTTLLNAVQRTAGGLALLAVMAASLASSAQAAEVVTTDCLHGSGDSYAVGSRTGYGGAYGNDYGNQYGSRYTFTQPSRSGFRRGFGGRFHREFVTGVRDPNGGGSISGVEAGTNSGYRNGYADEYGAGSRTAHGSTSCVEVRHELVNPYVIQVPRAEAENREAENHERLWRARCHPVVKPDRYGVNRYVYAAPGCEYGVAE